MTAPRFQAIVAPTPNAPATLRPYDPDLTPKFAVDQAMVWATSDTIGIGNRGILIGHLFERNLPSRRILSITPHEADRILQSEGRYLLDHYWGGYVAILQLPGSRMRILRDPSGLLPAYWRDTGSGLAITAEIGRPPFSHADGLRVDDDALIAHLWAPNPVRAATCLLGVSEVPPGYVLDITAGGIAETCVWSPWEFVGARNRSNDYSSALLQTTIIDTIRTWGACFKSIVLGISGGLDSSIVLAGLAQSNADVHVLTLFGPGPGGDERSFAACAAKAFNVHHTSQAYDPRNTDLVAPVVASAPRPFLAHFVQAIAQTHDLLQAQFPIDAFFSGNGGDNVFCQMHSATPIIDRLIARSNPRDLLTTFSDIRQITNADIFTLCLSIFRRLLAKRQPHIGNSSFLDPGRLAHAIDGLPSHPWLIPQGSALPGSVAHITSIARAMGNDGFHSRVSHPPSVSPLLSQPIVELCLSIPSWSWVAGGFDRSAARHAFRDILPKRLIERRTGGGPSGFVNRLYWQHEDTIMEQLRDGYLRRHNIIEEITRRSIADTAGDNMTMAPQRLLALVAADAWARQWEGS